MPTLKTQCRRSCGTASSERLRMAEAFSLLPRQGVVHRQGQMHLQRIRRGRIQRPPGRHRTAAKLKARRTGWRANGRPGPRNRWVPMETRSVKRTSETRMASFEAALPKLRLGTSVNPRLCFAVSPSTGERTPARRKAGSKMSRTQDEHPFSMDQHPHFTGEMVVVAQCVDLECAFRRLRLPGR